MVDKVPTKMVQIISQSDIMKTGQNYKIDKKIWEKIENKDNNENIEPETPTEPELRNVTFNVTYMGTPMTLESAGEIPITVDGVTKHINEENPEEVTFSLSDGSHNVKIITNDITYYDNIHIVDEEHTKFILDITSGLK